MYKIEFWGILIFLLLFSCGIPSFEYLAEPVITSSTDTSYNITINMIESPETIYFDIYSRYFVDKDSSDLFDDLELSDIDGDMENFLDENGFSIVKYLQDYTLTEENESDTEEKINVDYGTSNITFSVVLKEVEDISQDRVIISSDTMENELYLLSSYDVTNEPIHFIGDISDNMEETLQTQILKDDGDTYEKTDDINIEFVVVTYGVSESLTAIESMPVLVNKAFLIKN